MACARDQVTQDLMSPRCGRNDTVLALPLLTLGYLGYFDCNLIDSWLKTSYFSSCLDALGSVYSDCRLLQAR